MEFKQGYLILVNRKGWAYIPVIGGGHFFGTARRG